MNNVSNYQDLLKFLAIITMVIDHLGVYFFPKYTVLRLIGRTAMPIFCFFAGYNYKEKPKIKILLYGLVLYAITCLLLKKFIFSNILISIYLGQCYLYLFRDKLYNIASAYIHVIILAILGSVTCFISDYGSLAAAIMVLGYVAIHFPEQLKKTVLITMLLSIMHTVNTLNFAGFYIKMAIVIAILEYFIIIYKNFDKKINFNCKIISRNSLLIYTVHLIVFQSLFVYLLDW